MMTMYSKATAVKIVVSSISKVGHDEAYSIQVMDGSHIVHAEHAESKSQRDEIVWRLADLYNTPEIESIADQSKEAVEEFKFSEIPSIPVLQESDADQYFEENQQLVFDRIVQAVSEGVDAKRGFIRLFELNGTGVYVTSQREDWKSGLKQANRYYLLNENYEQCAIIKKLLAKL